MKLKPLLFTALSLAAGMVFAQADTDVTATKSKLDKWVETQQLISEQKNDWAVEKEILEDTRKLLEDELAMLEEKIAELEGDSTEADKERDQLLLNRVEFKRAEASMTDSIRQLEVKLLALVPQFPKPLRSKLEPYIVQIPKDPAKARVSLSDRLVTVLGILGQAERFNRSIHLFSSTEKIEGQGDEARQVWQLYWGLGAAYWVDSTGAYAGVGSLGQEGWEFSTDNQLAPGLNTLRNIKEGTEDEISFIEMPAKLQ